LANIAQTPAAAQEAARAAIKQREDGIRAQAIGEGRKLERADILKTVGAATIEEISLLEQVRFEHAAQLQAYEARWEREEAKHGRHRFWQGITLGSIIAGLGWGAFQLYTFNAISETIAQTTRQDVMTGAIVRAHSEGER